MRMRPAHMALIATLAVVAALLLAVNADAFSILKPVGFGPMSSAKAAKQVKRNGYEPRPGNVPRGRRPDFVAGG